MQYLYYNIELVLRRILPTKNRQPLMFTFRILEINHSTNINQSAELGIIGKKIIRKELNCRSKTTGKDKRGIRTQYHLRKRTEDIYRKRA